jgi:hypothetical protein
MSRGKPWLGKVAPKARNATCEAPEAALAACGENSVCRSRAWPVGNVGAWRRGLTTDPYVVLAAAGALYGFS